MKIVSLLKNFSGVRRNRLSRFIREAAARKRTGRWKIGSSYSQATATSQPRNTNRGGWESSSLLSSSQARQTKRRPTQLEHEWKDRDVRFAKNLSLPHLAAVLEHTIFMGHDSGISHLAAAAGANCILLFGPTDPNVWAPRNENVRVLQAQTRQTRRSGHRTSSSSSDDSLAFGSFKSVMTVFSYTCHTRVTLPAGVARSAKGLGFIRP